MTSCWIGVVSREHVVAAVSGGFCQVNHGKEAPLKRLHPGDRLVYYSAREGMRTGDPVQAFTAIGEILDSEPYQVSQSEEFRPFRRDVRYFEARQAPIGPRLAHLSFTRDKPEWRQALRRGLIRIQPGDYQIIANAMQVADTFEQ